MKSAGGFSLVELMVAMVIGLIIILGAGQLFLTVFQTNRQVETLSEKQAAVNFAVESLLRDIRRANLGDINWNGSSLTLTVPNRGDMSVSAGCAAGADVTKVYKLSDSAVSDREGWALEAGQNCSSTAPSGNLPDIVAAFAEDGFDVDGTLGGDGIWIITFRLLPTSGSGSDELNFYAVNRTAAVGGGIGGSGTNGGGDGTDGGGDGTVGGGDGTDGGGDGTDGGGDGTDGGGDGTDGGGDGTDGGNDTGTGNDTGNDSSNDTGDSGDNVGDQTTPVTCTEITVSGGMIQNQGDQISFVFSHGNPEGSCSSQGSGKNASYFCAFTEVLPGLVIDVKVDAGSKGTRTDSYSVDRNCQVSS